MKVRDEKKWHVREGDVLFQSDEQRDIEGQWLRPETQKLYFV
jgi:protoheme ferro-lyase